ncbi:hypothetical protein GCM10009422_25130 [Brevundimonas kwangchunensis]|uniref:Uncharacterized protein n=1 Tax=Brevundimonas kwangchunensis TaxID=322163 RepID=A0ABP3S664_9CAUL
MRLITVLALSGLSLTAAACASGPMEPASLSTGSGSPQPAENYDWFLSEDGDEARLAYGLEESDDLRIGLDCRRASGKLDLSAIAKAGARSEIHLESGGDTERYPAHSEPSELHDGLFLTAAARTSEPVFQRFRRVGWLAVWQGEERNAYAPHPQSAERIERFFAFCG